MWGHEFVVVSPSYISMPQLGQISFSISSVSVQNSTKVIRYIFWARIFVFSLKFPLGDTKLKLKHKLNLLIIIMDFCLSRTTPKATIEFQKKLGFQVGLRETSSELTVAFSSCRKEAFTHTQILLVG